MTNEQIGMLIIGLGVLINFGIQFYKLFYKDNNDTRAIIQEQEMKFMKELHETNIKNLQYQKDIVTELTKLNESFRNESAKIDYVFNLASENKEELGYVKERVVRLENTSQQ